MDQGYSTPREHFDDHLVRVRLWLERYLVRFGYRLLDSNGKQDDSFVSAAEAVAMLQREPRPAPALPGLRGLDAIAADLAAHEEAMAGRLAQTEDLAAVPIDQVRARFSLSVVAADLLVALAAFQARLDLARLFRFAWADFTIQQPTVGFLLDLIASDDDGRDRLHVELDADRPLRRTGLVYLEQARGWDGPTPLLFLRGRIPDSLADLIVRGQMRSGVAHPLAPTASLVHFPSQAEARKALREALRPAHGKGRTRPIALIGRAGGGRASLASTVVGAPGLGAVDLAAVARNGPAFGVALLEAIRDALLLGLVPLLRGDAWLEEATPEHLDGLRHALDAFPGPILLTATDASAVRGLELDVADVAIPSPTAVEQRELWRATFAAHGVAEPPEGLDRVTESYQLTPQQLVDAAAAVAAETRKRAVTRASLVRCIRKQLPQRVAKLAELTETPQTWDDLLLPEDAAAELRYLASCARHSGLVYDTWNFRSRVPYGQAISALFHGPPGTGKTMAAGVVARELGRELYRVDLSRVVDKYVGETEKNLGRLFDHAEQAQAVLFFDEADALFARRTEVKSSNDRYANLGVNYLLQRMESYDGVTILTTNFDDSLDEALARRIGVKVRFPMPDATMRELLWRKLVPPEAPIERDVAWARLATTFDFAGGHIKSAVIRAAFTAAEQGVPMSFEGLWRAAVSTYREMGKLVTSEMTAPRR